MTSHKARWLAAAIAWSITGTASAASCSIAAVSLVFGNYNPLQIMHTDTTGNIAVTCTGAVGEVVTYSIALSSGAGSFGARRMSSPGGGTLGYNIYTTAARATVWGDGSGGTNVRPDAYTLTTPVVTRNYPVYGRAFAAQKAVVGAYTDAIVVTLNF